MKNAAFSLVKCLKQVRNSGKRRFYLDNFNLKYYSAKLSVTIGADKIGRRSSDEKISRFKQNKLIYG